MELSIALKSFRANFDFTNSNRICKAAQYVALLYILFFGCWYLMAVTSLLDWVFFLLPFVAILQIYHNAWRSRKYRFDFNFTCLYALRFGIVILAKVKGNVYLLEPSFWYGTTIICVVLLHLAMLYIQSLVGSRFIVPKALLPQFHNYI